MGWHVRARAQAATADAGRVRTRLCPPDASGNMGDVRESTTRGGGEHVAKDKDSFEDLIDKWVDDIRNSDK
jgi:hypothetical protein